MSKVKKRHYHIGSTDLDFKFACGGSIKKWEVTPNNLTLDIRDVTCPHCRATNKYKEDLAFYKEHIVTVKLNQPIGSLGTFFHPVDKSRSFTVGIHNLGYIRSGYYIAGYAFVGRGECNVPIFTNGGVSLRASHVIWEKVEEG